MRSSTPRRIASTWPTARSRPSLAAGRAPRCAALAAAGLLALSGTGCSGDGDRFDPIDAVRASYSDEEAREVGFEFDRSLQQRVRVVDDPVVSGFVNDLGRSILAAAGQPSYVYRFRLIQDSSLNAFAVFGGYVYFHTGTMLTATGVDELAGVMGHEIAHVRLRHHSRMAEQSQIPDLVATLAGIGAAIGTGETGALIAAQGINVALKLRFSREFEAEADREGTRLMAAAGYDPTGITRFFARLLALRRGYPDQLPPYLYSHPDVERRIDAVEVYAEGLPLQTRPASLDLDSAFRNAQARLAALLAREGGRLLGAQPSSDPRTGPLIAAAQAAEQRGEPETARSLLTRARAEAPADPRAHFASGEFEQRQARSADAAHHYRRAIALDPTRALVFFRLGEAYESLGEAQLAVFAYEHAARRAGPAGSSPGRAEREIEKLPFTVVEEAGFADARRDAATPFGEPVKALPAGAPKLAWWARLGPRFAAQPERLTVEFEAPDGSRHAAEVRAVGARLVGATLALPRPAEGSWTAVARLDGDPIDRRTLRLGSPVSEN
jgi:predicted Zn-dependent protease